jgi:hypothetical protein
MTLGGFARITWNAPKLLSHWNFRVTNMDNPDAIGAAKWVSLS